MNTFSILRVLIGFVASCVWFTPSPAQGLDDAVGVPVRLWGKGIQYAGGAEQGELNLGLSVMPSSSYPTGDFSVSWISPSLTENTPFPNPAQPSTVKLIPGKVYSISVEALFTKSFTIYAVSPQGYEIELAGAPRRSFTVSNSGYYTSPITLRVISANELSGRAGDSSSLLSGRIFWQVALGALKNGSSAGAITLADPGLDPTFASIASPAALQYSKPSSEIQVYQNPNLRQILANQAIVDVETVDSTSYRLKFYDLGQKVGSSFPYSFTGSPFIIYTVAKTANTTLQITSQTPTRTAVTSLERIGAAAPYDWVLQDWHTSSEVSLVEEFRDGGGSTADRSEKRSVRQPSQTDVTYIDKTFHAYPWGEELVTAVAGTSAENPVTTVLDYYDSTNQQTSYGFLKSRSSGGSDPAQRSWEAYTYDDSNLYKSGMVVTRHRPYNNSPTAITTTLGVGEVTSFSYDYDAFGMLTRPAVIETIVGTEVTARSETTYTSSTYPGSNTLWTVQATRNDYSASGAFLTTTTKYFREDAGLYVDQSNPMPNIAEEFFRGQLYSVQRPDGVKQSFAYQRGTFDSTSGVFAVNADGVATRAVAVTGTAAAGTSVYDGATIDGVTLIDKKSTAEITIRDERALVRRVETRVWSDGVWQTVAFTSFGYDVSGQLTSRVASNGANNVGATYTATFSGEQLSLEIDPSGIETSYTYDAAGRVATAQKTSGPKVTFGYDAESRETSRQLSATGTSETITSGRTYDTAGRVKTETSPGPNGGMTTNFAYNPSARQVTVTLPNGGIRVETYQRDGTTENVTGSAVISQYFTYNVLSGGSRYARVNVGSPGSSRQQESTRDWLGRTTQSSRPGFTGQPAFIEQAAYDPATGRLTRSTQPGPLNGSILATRYEYDELSRVNRTGLDIGDNGLATGSTDRITDIVESFENSGGWWLKRVTKTYPVAGSSAELLLSTAKQRLSGFTNDVQAETVSTDVDGNTTTRTVRVNRPSRTTTTTTTVTGYTNPQIETVVNGLAMSVTRFDGLIYATGYDFLHRRNTSVDPRAGLTTTIYRPNSSFVYQVQDAAGKFVATYEYDNAGRVVGVTDAAGRVTRTSYDSRDLVLRQWGHSTYPVEYGYNSFGERITMSTYRGGSGWTTPTWPGTTGTADTTSWSFDVPSGLLASKTYPAADPSHPSDPTLNQPKTVSYTYNQRGQTASRTWARGVATTYTYDPATAELIAQDYSDSTPDVTYTYTRLGQLNVAADGMGQRSFIYNTTQPLQLDAVEMPAFFGSRVLTRQYDGLKRPAGFRLGITSNLSSDLAQTHTYNDLGRFASVASASAVQPSRTFSYSYNGGGLVSGLTVGSLSVNRTYEPNRDLLTVIEATWSGTSRTRFDYTYNDLGQRTSAKQSGNVFVGSPASVSADFESSTYYRYVYNERGELVDATNYLGEDPTNAGAPQLSGRHHAFTYDNIGNRLTSTRTGTAGAPDDYATYATNQYKNRENNVTYLGGTATSGSMMTISGGNPAPVVGRQGRYWGAQAMFDTSAGPVKGDLTIKSTLVGAGTGGANLVRTETRSVVVPQAVQSFTYDADGNLKADGMWTYTYDAENRLITMASSLPPGMGFTRQVLDFKYDYLGRRVQKTVFNLDTSQYISGRRYLYDGWDLVAEYDAPGGTSFGSLLRSYTWGLDLAGSLTATGGVGALVQLTDHLSSTSYFPTYDGNGNVASLLRESDGSVAAKYEYSPFGELLRCEGSYATNNPFRFSTKFSDDESGLVYYGARFYSPNLGRFINRDPIEEQGGFNLYGFCGNDGINHWDRLGYSWLSKTIKKIGNWISDHRREIGAIVGIVAAFYTGGLAANWATGAGWGGGASAALSGGVAGFTGGVTSTSISGGNLRNTLRAGLFGAGTGAAVAFGMYKLTEAIYSWLTPASKREAQLWHVTDAENKIAEQIDAAALEDESLTGNLWINGQSNRFETAINLGEKYTGRNDFYMAYNPTKSSFADTLESTLDKLSGQSPISRSTAKILGKFDLTNTTIYAHSQGAIIARNALVMRQAAGQATTGLRVALNGAAVNELSTRSVLKSMNAELIRFRVHTLDVVPNVVGYDALTYFNPLRLAGSIIVSPLLAVGEDWSPHTYPGGGSHLAWVPNLYETLHLGGR